MKDAIVAALMVTAFYAVVDLMIIYSMAG